MTGRVTFDGLRQPAGERQFATGQGTEVGREPVDVGPHDRAHSGAGLDHRGVFAVEHGTPQSWASTTGIPKPS